LETVHRPVEELAKAISQAPTAVVTIDAIDEEDLLQISRAILLGDFLPCGGAGLANAWAQTLRGVKPARVQTTLPFTADPLLIVSGSANPKTHEQVSALAAHPESLIWKMKVPLDPGIKERWFETAQAGWRDIRVMVMCPGNTSPARDPEWLKFFQTASCLAMELLERIQLTAILIVGGETANFLCGLLEVQEVQLSGEALPGIPYGTVSGGRADRATLLTKAGGNGQVDCLEKLVYG
jgi:uncharacterized protein YgbK (DUF1537 family)